MKMIFNRIPIWVNLKRIKLLKRFCSLIIEYFNNIEPISYLRYEKIRKFSHGLGLSKKHPEKTS
jgi:hypothetical protein